MPRAAAYSFTPTRMNADAAAYYLGVSRTKFLRRVSDGEYPPAVRDEGNTLWLREDLDDYVARRHSRSSNRGKPTMSVEEQINARHA